VLAWCCELLGDPRSYVVRGSMLAFNNMAVTGGLPASAWRSADDAIVSAYDGSLGDRERHSIMSELLVSLPPATRRRLRARLVVPLRKPERLARYGAKDDDNPEWSQSQRIARDITSSYALSDPDLLTRLVFELIYDHRDARSVTTMFLILATPIAGSLVEALFERATELPDADRSLTLDRLMTMQSGHGFPTSSHWPRPDDLDDLYTDATLRAQASRKVPDATLDLLRDGGRHYARRSLYVAGLLRSPWLRRQAADQRLDARFRSGADWWISQGGVVRH